MPDLGKLLVLNAPGEVLAEAVPDQGFWLDVGQAGLYSLALDGPGLIGLTDFDTPDGRSDGSHPQVRLMQAGSAYETGVLKDLFLVPGHAYLVQIAAIRPLGVRLVLERPLDLSKSLSGADIPGHDPENPLVLNSAVTAEQYFLLRPDGPLGLTLATPGDGLFQLDLLTPPSADVRTSFAGMSFGPGGIFPVGGFETARLELEGQPGADGSLPLYLLRFGPFLKPGGLDEVEPGETDLGPLSEVGRTLRGTLLARDDRDSFAMTLDQTGIFDLAADVPGADMAYLSLHWNDVEILTAEMSEGQMLRPGLVLQPGSYRLAISGAQDMPLDYEISLVAAVMDQEGEPDDRPELARVLPEGQAVRGTLGPGNPGHIRFVVSVPGHLWELRGVQGLTSLELIDGNETIIGRWEAQSGAIVLPLVLPPGQYTAQLRGLGPYALRLTDKGPAPAGFEAEPNDTDTMAIRLAAGSTASGEFQTLADSDFFEINLTAPTPLKITVVGPDDGPMVADIFAADAGILRAEVAQGAAPVSYAAVYPAGRHLIQLRARQDGLSGRYTLSVERTNEPEPYEPIGVAAMPGDGFLAGQIGGFDAMDQIFVGLPQGAGNLSVSCQGAMRSWEIWTLGDEVRLYRADPGQTLVMPYAPDLGGAVSLRIHIDPQDSSGPYDCRVRHAPKAALDLPADPPHEEARDASAPSSLQPGHSVTGQFDSASDRDTIELAMSAGQFVGLRCDVPAERLLMDYAYRLALEGPALDGGIRPFLAGSEPLQLEINPPGDGTFPIGWTCALMDEAAFVTPAMAGPTAEFTGYKDPQADPAAPTVFDPKMTLALLSGGRPDWLSPRQETDDLNVTLSLTGLETAFRAYDPLGQSAHLVLNAANPGNAPLTLRYDLAALADGWRVAPEGGELKIAAGAEATLPVTITLPPMQSPVTDPQLLIRARADHRSTSATFPVRLDAAASARDPQRFWSAPAALRGGLNPMQWQFGGRLIALDGVPVDEDTANRFAFLHDGAAFHSAIPSWFRARTATFELAGEAPVAGLFVHLRTTEGREKWPGHLQLDLSSDGKNWAAAGSFNLSASDLPQIFTVDQPATARFARLTIPGCRANPSCNEIAFSEVGLIAAPDWRFDAAIDLADPLLGGHVVWAQTLGGTDADEYHFGGQWNSNLLTLGQAGYLAAAREDRGDRAVAVIGFHGARAARIAALQWDGTAEDFPRLDGADVAVSLVGPAGPWQEVGLLPSPPVGQQSAQLTFSTPVWARAVRLTFNRHPTEDRALPDRIRVWEDRSAPPLWGLWEDDRPDAGYENTQAPVPVLAPEPKGGPDAPGAVPLPMDQTVASSVQLERNVDWWRVDLPQGPPRRLTFRFADAAQPEFVASLTGPDGQPVALDRLVDEAGDLILSAAAQTGTYVLSIEEPPRSVAILWDTSGSVQTYVPGILEAVRLWSQSLKPGRDRLQLLPFGQNTMLLGDWAGRPEDVYPALVALPRNDSSDSESAMGVAALALAGQDGQRGIVVVTDAETSQAGLVWGPLLRASPRVVALSIDSGDATGVNIMKDWASLNGGHFARVTGNAGLADGLDLAAALFRAPKGYALTVSVEELREPEGQGLLRVNALPAAPDAAPSGGIEVILDASGSMLKRMPDGQRRIQVAHDALANLVETTLPEGTPFAFRAFGLQADACNSELIVPLGPLQRADAAEAIRNVPAVNLAKTAIAASLALAAQDLSALSPPRVVVLVTDGEETCDGDMEAEIARLKEAGLDLRLTIVGFAIDDTALAATFATWAEAGGGQYLSAGDSAGLDASITESIAPRFAIERLFVDGRTEAVGVTGLDQETPLPAGRYRLRPLQTAQGDAILFEISDAETSTLAYDPTLGILAE